MTTFKLGTLAQAAALLLVAAPALAQTTEIKVATLAPKGSAWAKLMEQGARDLDTATSGRVKIKYFFSGQQGDEREVVRKMKLKHLDGAAVTATGLSIIKSDVRVLELPYLFKSDRELDLVRNKLQAEFEKQFDEAGYVLLAWGDVGWTHLYSNTPVTNRDELQKTKMWAWSDDIIVKTLFKRLGVNGVPLGVPDVLPSLQTGLIDACYGSPLVAGAFSWWTKVKFATAKPINYSVGALVVRKEVFEKLSAADQAALRKSGAELGEGLKTVVRKDNERWKKLIEKSGVKFVEAPPAAMAEFEKEGQAVWQELAGSLYSKELLASVKAALAEARK